jgi:hypothetical protein
VNTAARIESTGERSRIHLSKECADLIVAAGKSEWVKPRDTMVTAKGKGRLQTYWLNASLGSSVNNERKGNKDSDIIRGTEDELGDSLTSLGGSVGNIINLFETREKVNNTNDKTLRLVNWNVEILLEVLKKNARTVSSKIPETIGVLSVPNSSGKRTVFDEQVDVIDLPSKPAVYTQDLDKVVLSKKAISQLHDYVLTIAKMHKTNKFHSFEHASHVSQSVIKLWSRISRDAVALVSPNKTPKISHKKQIKASSNDALSSLISGDPLMQFTCIFAALIHDVGHPGVSNALLVEEQAEIAVLYHNNSVTESNSIDVAWDLLMEPAYEEFRKCIYSTQAELEQFRQCLVNCVLATDLVDKKLSDKRQARWDTVFATKYATAKSREPNRKATLVLELLLQASDAAHYMQHWNIFVKWNRMEFEESDETFKSRRVVSTQVDPSKGWYEHELAFFDTVVIPLARKLKECEIFGVASDEYLNYASANRRDWELKGRDVVEEHVRVSKTSAHSGGNKSKSSTGVGVKSFDSSYGSSISNWTGQSSFRASNNSSFSSIK